VVEDDRACRTGNRLIHVGVGEHHVRRLAAQFQRHLLQVARGSPDDAFADRGGAGESDLVDPSVYSRSGHVPPCRLRLHRTIVVGEMAR
jgi:hypothetical protein